jgi:hypothetical protein
MASANKAEKLQMGFVIRAKGNNNQIKKIGVFISFTISKFLQSAKTTFIPVSLFFLFFSFFQFFDIAMFTIIHKEI